MAALNFDPTLHASAAAGTAEQATQTGGVTVAAVTTATATAKSTGKLVEFEGFLTKAGHLTNVVLSDVIKYLVPVAQVAALVDPSAESAVAAFTTSVQLVQSTVLATQQRWAAAGSAANTQKLADVLTVVEQPIIQLFAQAGLHVDTDYVVNLVNGVVAILNAQPSATLAVTTAATTTAAA